MQLSQKEKLFSEFVSKFLNSTLNFEHFQKPMTILATFIMFIDHCHGMWVGKYFS